MLPTYRWTDYLGILSRNLRENSVQLSGCRVFLYPLVWLYIITLRIVLSITDNFDRLILLPNASFRGIRLWERTHGVCVFRTPSKGNTCLTELYLDALYEVYAGTLKTNCLILHKYLPVEINFKGIY